MNNRQNNTTFEEPRRRVPCTRKVEKRILANLQQAAHGRLNGERARRARELLEQLEPKPVAADRPKPSEQTAASSPPVVVPEHDGPQPMANRWHRFRSAVQQGLEVVVQRARTFRQRGRTRQ
jgi:hypothetical protein